MTNSLTSIFPSNPNQNGRKPKAIAAIAALFALLAAAIPNLGRTELAETLRSFGEKIRQSAGKSDIQRISLALAFSDAALTVTREAHLRGYLTQAEVSPTKNGITDALKAATDAKDVDASVNVFAGFFDRLAGLIDASTSHDSDTGPTGKSIAAAIRDHIATVREFDIPMWDAVDGVNPMLDRAIEIGVITEDDVQDHIDNFTDDREGGYAWMTFMADLIEKKCTQAVAA